MTQGARPDEKQNNQWFIKMWVTSIRLMNEWEE